jgi:hypothetical protein
MSEARTSRLEADVDAIKATLARLEPLIHRIDATLNATLPTLATKVELAALDVRFTGELATLREALADKPGKIYLATATACCWWPIPRAWPPWPRYRSSPG